MVLTGVSGAGKTLALQTLEDIGYFCIDNLLPSLLKTLTIRVKQGQRVAVVVDTRSGGSVARAGEGTAQRGRLHIPGTVVIL